VPGLIILDRDGVLNAMVVDAEHGTIDSPLCPDQVELMPGAAAAVGRLCAAGFTLAIASNQPAAAKGKTTRPNIDAVHAAVVGGIELAGGRIASSHICFHRREDLCACRKPKPGLLQAALLKHSHCDPAMSWMVGDGATDIEAGAAVGLRTALIAPRACSACKVMAERSLKPDFWGDSLMEFADAMLRGDI
jgi:D-glycero-D-manno-heptose 1,7-bisphosphate phosphatase